MANPEINFPFGKIIEEITLTLRPGEKIFEVTDGGETIRFDTTDSGEAIAVFVEYRKRAGQPMTLEEAEKILQHLLNPSLGSNYVQTAQELN